MRIYFYLPILLLFSCFTDKLDVQEPSSSVSWEMSDVIQRKYGRDLKIPQITKYKNQEVLTLINAKILDNTKDLYCHPEYSSNTEADTNFDVKINVDFDQADILSVYATAAYYCGGAYPTNDSPFSMTFDLASGQIVEFTDLFENYQENASSILELIFEAHKASLSDAEKEFQEEGSCTADLYAVEHLESSSFDYTFSANGLRVQPSWPHVIEACSERVTVPYKKLAKFAKHGSILARIISLNKVYSLLSPIAGDEISLITFEAAV